MTTTDHEQPITDVKKPITTAKQATPDTNGMAPQTPVDQIVSVASSIRIFGDPIVTQGRTIVPVAMVAMGFRGGFWGKIQGAMGGATANKPSAGESQGQGGVMRRMMIRPVGYIDITPAKSRFVTIAPGRFVALGFGLAFMLGGLMMGSRRRMRHNQ